MVNPVVSIIVPVYGVEKYVDKCVESLVFQTYKDIEVIFVDDCTPDRSVDVINNTVKHLSASDFNYKILHHDKNRGLSAARNTGVSAAKGDYIMHVDADDWIEPEMVASMVETARTSKADIVICGAYVVRNSGKKQSLPNPNIDKGKLIEDILYKNTPGSMWAKLIDRNLYDSHADVWSIEGINHGEDYATMPRLLYYAGSVAYVLKPLYNYNLTNVGSYTNNFSKKSMESMLRADGVLEDFFTDKVSKSVINRMKLRTKLGIIKRGNPSLYKDLVRIYNDIPKSDIRSLSLTDRILLAVIGRGFDKTIANYINRRLHT